MSDSNLLSLDDCTEFRQTLAARPPAIVHGTVLLLLLLVAAAIVWSALVNANLVVIAPGRVRSVEIPARVFTAAGSELDGRVVEAPFTEGDSVCQGDLLLRLDTQRIDSRIAKLKSEIMAADQELTELDRLDQVHSRRFESAQSKARLELDQATQQLDRQRAQKASELRQAKASLALVRDGLERIEVLKARQAATERDVVEAATKVKEAQERLVQAELPIDEHEIGVKQRALELVTRDYEVRQAELAAQRAIKQGELEAARKELEILEVQRNQATMRAPINGVVVSGRIKPGDVLESGVSVMEIAPQSGFQFEGTVPGEDVGHLRMGMPVRIKFDAYDYQKYGVLEGRVAYISPDSKLEPTQKAAEVVRYMVRIDLLTNEVGRGSLRGTVKLGLGGTAEIVTGRESVLTILLRKVRQTVSLG